MLECGIQEEAKVERAGSLSKGIHSMLEDGKECMEVGIGEVLVVLIFGI